MSASADLRRASRILISTVDQEFILQKQIHVETTHHVDDPTLYGVRSSGHEPSISCGPVIDIGCIHASGRVLVPQLTRQLRDLDIGAVTQQRLDAGTISIRVGGRGQERTVQVDVDLTEQRMQPVINRANGIDEVEVGLIGSGHIRLYV